MVRPGQIAGRGVVVQPPTDQAKAVLGQHDVAARRDWQIVRVRGARHVSRHVRYRKGCNTSNEVAALEAKVRRSMSKEARR